MFEIGASRSDFPGLAKLNEECGELIQVIGKMIEMSDTITPITGTHHDGSNLIDRFESEMADVLAAIDYVMISNDLTLSKITERRNEKLKKFMDWHVAKQTPTNVNTIHSRHNPSEDARCSAEIKPACGGS